MAPWFLMEVTVSWEPTSIEGRKNPEAACTVHEDSRGRGLGPLLQRHLEDDAKRNGFIGAVGAAFQDEVPMLKNLARKSAYSGEILEDGVLGVVWYFGAPSD